VRITGEVQNTFSAKLPVEVEVISGLKQIQGLPKNLVLAPGESAPLAISGLAKADAAVVQCRGSFGVRQVAVRLVRIARKDLAAALPLEGRLSYEACFEPSRLAHCSGRSLADATAMAGQCWLAEPGRAEPGYVVYGPYRPTPPGHYLALFRMKRTGQAVGEVAVVDAALTGGRKLASARCDAAQLPDGQYTYVPLRFDHPGGSLETRVLWRGKAALAIDCVTLWREP